MLIGNCSLNFVNLHFFRVPMIKELTSNISFESFKKEVLEDYKIACLSRAVSLLGRKEVLTGKAKFGIFGDGKELPQLAMAKAFEKGDFRSGYYKEVLS